MKISGVFELVNAQNASNSSVVKGKILNKSPKHNNVYTVSLNNNVEISVAFSKEDLKAGDIVEIPISLLKQVDQGSAFVGADNVELTSSTLDKIMNLLSEISGSGKSGKSTDSDVAMLHSLISLMPEHKQEKLFQKILENVIQGSVESSGEGAAQVNVANSTDWAVRLVAEFIGELIEDLPDLYEKLSLENKNKALDILSILLQRSVVNTDSLKGVSPLDTALVRDALSLVQTPDIIIPRGQSASVSDSQILMETTGGEILREQPAVVSGSLSLIPTTDDVIPREQSVPVPDLVMKTKGAVISHDLPTPPEDSRQQAVFSLKNGVAVLALPEKLLSIVEKINSKDSLWISSYDPAKSESVLEPMKALAEPGSRTNSVNDIHYVSIFRESGASKEFQKLLQIRFPILNNLYEKIPTKPDVLKAVSLGSLELLENKLQLMNEKTLLPGMSDVEKHIPLLKTSESLLTNSFVSERDPFLVQSAKVALIELLEKGETPVFNRIVSQIEPVVSLSSSLERIIDLTSEVLPEVKGDPAFSPAMLKALNSFEQFYGDMLQKVEALINPEMSNDTTVKNESIKLLADLWGMFFESRVKESEVKSEFPEPGLKQHLQILAKELTSVLVSKSLPDDSLDENRIKDLLKHIQKEVADTISKIEGSQIISQPKETPSEKEQTLWLPVNIGGEWTRLGLEIKRDGKGKGKHSKLGSRVNIYMELKKMGRVTAELDLDANKQLRVKLGATETKAMKWFKEHENEIVASLDNGALKSVIFSLRLPSASEKKQRSYKQDSFQVSG